jgi:hypothetical protein
LTQASNASSARLRRFRMSDVRKRSNLQLQPEPPRPGGNLSII